MSSSEATRWYAWIDTSFRCNLLLPVAGVIKLRRVPKSLATVSHFNLHQGGYMDGPR